MASDWHSFLDRCRWHRHLKAILAYAHKKRPVRTLRPSTWRPLRYKHVRLKVSESINKTGCAY